VAGALFPDSPATQLLESQVRKLASAIAMAIMIAALVAISCRSILGLSPADTLRIFSYVLASTLLGIGTYAGLHWLRERIWR
jgi:hypothetical protein